MQTALALLLLFAQQPNAVDPTARSMTPAGKLRSISFTVDEGTDLSISVAPDGRWLAFDLLGHIHRLPIEGGQAVVLTQNSGVALNFHPAISPDGRHIAFISDRAGQNNVWVMNSDGSQPRPVFLDADTRFTSPAWAPDGRSIVAVRVYPTPGRGWHRQMMELWRLWLDGRPPTRLLGDRLTQYDAPAFSPDGRSLFFQVSYSIGDGLGMLTAGHRLQQLELATGMVSNVRTSEPAKLSPEFVRALRAGAYAGDVPIDPPAALTPVVSPDSKQIAFGLEQPNRTFTWRGHEFGPRTVLAVRDLQSGDERIVLDPATKDLTQVNAQYAYRVFPGFGWMPDGKSIVAAQEGKIRRVDLTTGSVSTIPFVARVERVISEQVRGRIKIDDDSMEVRFIQWPVGSPDGQRLAFSAVGKLWLIDLPNGRPRQAAPDLKAGLELTPAWSPDGRRLAFTAWDDRDRGHVYVMDLASGVPKRVTTEASEYLYPVWAPDGASLVVVQGPGPQGTVWNAWQVESGWRAVRLSLNGGAVKPLVQLMGPVPLWLGTNGRVFFQTFHPGGALYYPFPSDSALRDHLKVRSVAADGSGSPRDEVILPAARNLGSEPVLSPTGRWVAFQAGRALFLSPPSAGKSPLVTDPNRSAPGRIRVDQEGAVYQSWRDRTTLQYASGNHYVTYDAVSGVRKSTVVRLRVPRPHPAGSIALVDAKIITADSGRVLEHGTVVVRGSRISCVGQCDTTGVDRVLSLSGKTVMPGMIDMHAHHTQDDAPVIPRYRTSNLLDLAYGVTTILDPATRSESALPIAELIEAGGATGPRTFSVTEFVIHPGTAWGDQRIIRTAADAAWEVNRRADWGAVSIKNYRQSRRAQHQMILAAARARGITVTSEGGPLFFDLGLTMDGQTGWEHFLAPLPLYRDATTFFGQARVVYSPTVIVAGHPNGAKEYYRPHQGLLQDIKYLRFMPRAEVAARSRNHRETPLSAVSFPIVAEGLADMVRAGGFGAIGEHGEQPGIGSHWELWAYAQALSPLEAITVATLHGAWFIGLDQETGSITPGKLADLIVLNSDPMVDIRNSIDIAWVMKAGRLYDDDTLTEIWPERRELGPLPWNR